VVAAEAVREVSTFSGQAPTCKFAKSIYLVAGIYGLLVLIS
jgi:hypothetical protein